MKRIQDLLEDFANEYGLHSKALDIKALEVFIKLQSEDTSLQKLLVVGVHKGILRLKSQNSIEGFQIMMKKTSILQTINHQLGQNILKDILIESRNG